MADKIPVPPEITVFLPNCTEKEAAVLVTLIDTQNAGLNTSRRPASIGEHWPKVCTAGNVLFYRFGNFGVHHHRLDIEGRGNWEEKTTMDKEPARRNPLAEHIEEEDRSLLDLVSDVPVKESGIAVANPEKEK